MTTLKTPPRKPKTQPSVYPWADWFARRSEFTLRQGRDFPGHVLPSSMGLMVRAKVSRSIKAGNPHKLTGVRVRVLQAGIAVLLNPPDAPGRHRGFAVKPNRGKK